MLELDIDRARNVAREFRLEERLGVDEAIPCVKTAHVARKVFVYTGTERQKSPRITNANKPRTFTNREVKPQIY